MNMDYKKYFTRQVKSKKPITVPKGPKMLRRKKKMTIRDRKLQKDLLIKKEKEEKEFKVKFKAKQLPPEIT